SAPRFPYTTLFRSAVVPEIGGRGASWLAQPSKRETLALATLHCDEDVDLVAVAHLAVLPLAARHDRLIQRDRDARGILLTGLVGDDLSDRQAVLALALFLVHRVVHYQCPLAYLVTGILFAHYLPVSCDRFSAHLR